MTNVNRGRYETDLKNVSSYANAMESFDRVEHFILDVNQSVATSRDLCERVCRDLRQLLHQPWPPRAKSLKSSVPPTADGIAGNHGDGISQEEAETLTKVEQILAKAQRARELQRKLNPSEEVVPDGEGELPDNDQPAENPPPRPSSQLIDGQEFAVISQSSLQKIFADVKPQNPGRGVGAGAGKTPAPKPRPGTAQARAAYNAKVPRPRPAVKSQFKTSSSEIGRNIVSKPPGKVASNKNGEPKAHLVGHKVPRAAALKKNGSRTSSSNSANQLGKPVATGSKRQEKSQDQHAGRLKSETKQSRSISGTTTKENRASMLPGGSETDSHTSLNGQTDKLAQKTAELRLCDISTLKQTVSDGISELGVDAKEERPFMLRRDGADLKVPGKLKKLHADIAKLRQRLSLLLTSNEVSEPAQHFLHRLESKIHPASPASAASPSLEEMQDRIDEQVTRCRHLIQVAETALRTFPHHDASWDSRYRIRVLAKALRTNLDELRREAQSITAAERNLLSSDPSRLPSVVPPSPADCYSCEHNSLNPSTTFFLPLQENSQGFTTQPCSVQLTHRNYQYSDLKDVQRLATLQHDAQRLAIQIHLEKLIGSEMLPVLERMDPSDVSFISLYRSLYGLLCHGGKLYPAIIGDSIGNDSNLETS